MILILAALFSGVLIRHKAGAAVGNDYNTQGKKLFLKLFRTFLGYDDACVLDLTSSDRAEKRWYGPPVPPKVFHHHNDHQHDIDHTHQHIQEHSHKVSFIKTV